MGGRLGRAEFDWLRERVQMPSTFNKNAGGPFHPSERQVSIRLRRVQPLLKAGGDPRARRCKSDPASSCEQPLIITQPMGRHKTDRKPLA